METFNDLVGEMIYGADFDSRLKVAVRSGKSIEESCEDGVVKERIDAIMKGGA